MPKTAYEYAMLYGIQRPLQQRLVAAGRPLRVLIAYGEYWFSVVHAPPRRASGERVVCRQEPASVALRTRHRSIRHVHHGIVVAKTSRPYPYVPLIIYTSLCR